MSLNERILWSRWRLGSEDVATVFIPADIVREDDAGNALMIENTSRSELVMDAMWIEPARPEDTVFVALRDADWMTSPPLTRSLPFVAAQFLSASDPGVPLHLAPSTSARVPGERQRHVRDQRFRSLGHACAGRARRFLPSALPSPRPGRR